MNQTLSLDQKLKALNCAFLLSNTKSMEIAYTIGTRSGDTELSEKLHALKQEKIEKPVEPVDSFEDESIVEESRKRKITQLYDPNWRKKRQFL